MLVFGHMVLVIVKLGTDRAVSVVMGRDGV